MTITVLSITLSSPASSHCRRNSNSFLVNRHYYSSASNSLLARTSDRTPKTFALQGDPSRSKRPPSPKRSPYIVYPAGLDVTWNDLAHSSRIFSPNRDIEKIPAPLRSHMSSPNLSPRLPEENGSCHLCSTTSGRVSKTARGEWSCHLCSTTSGRVSKTARGKCSPAIRKINPNPDAESYARVMPD
ncbi:hypothetical protein AVEN_86395-1 [Araneus ventricosus]|uniref:Uncharacterized protein n=1 Tax=Araneus ventricosus TaxID=182803 RepID=A0A4Y2WYF8_ARAVE|nr:hypothetical protein AVEN_86395-1 [Araneus ventricosus]